MGKSFTDFVTRSTEAMKMFAELGKYKMIEVARNESGKSIDIHKHYNPKASDIANNYMQSETGTALLLESYLFSKLAVDGIKLFKPTVEVLAPLEYMDMNLGFEDYVQPFDLMVIDFPLDYSERRNTSMGIQYPEIPSGMHKPVSMIMYHERGKGLIIGALMFDSDIAIKIAIIDEGDGMSIHDRMMLRKKSTFKDSINITDDEREMLNDATLLCMNYCLLLDEVGVRKVGVRNQKHLERLKKFQANAKDAATVQRLAREIRSMPVYYEIAQEVKLYRHETDIAIGDSVETGRHNKPHHRRGHWRMQRCGPQLSLRKRIRIDSVFVNHKLFVGEAINNRATYS